MVTELYSGCFIDTFLPFQDTLKLRLLILLTGRVAITTTSFVVLHAPKMLNTHYCGHLTFYFPKYEALAEILFKLPALLLWSSGYYQDQHGVISHPVGLDRFVDPRNGGGEVSVMHYQASCGAVEIGGETNCNLSPYFSK